MQENKLNREQAINLNIDRDSFVISFMVLLFLTSFIFLSLDILHYLQTGTWESYKLYKIVPENIALSIGSIIQGTNPDKWIGLKKILGNCLIFLLFKCPLSLLAFVLALLSAFFLKSASTKTS